MRVRDPRIFEGWALQAAKENHNAKHMPVFVAQAIHPDCEQPTHVWAMAIGIQRERLALRTGERLPREIVGVYSATMDAAEAYLDRQISVWVQDLAYGSWDEWSK